MDAPRVGDRNDRKAGLSFGFKKKQDIVHLERSVVSEDIEKEVKETDYVVSLEGKEVKSKDSSKTAKQEYSIPLIKHNSWRKADVTGFPTNKLVTQLTDISTSSALDSLDEQAAKEILQDTVLLNQQWIERGKEDTSIAIPLLLQNKIPDGFESEEKLDVALRPDEPSEADYEQIPIEHFGFAMLRGMGWKKDRGIGKNGKVIAPVEAHIRPKGLGLGADRNNSVPDKKIASNHEANDKEEELVLNKNAFCVVVSGINKNLYGTVEGIDEDNARIVLKLARSGKIVNILQSSVRVVNKQEFDKYSRYLNQEKVEKYKEDEKRRTEIVEENGYGKRHNELRSQKYESKKTLPSDEDSDDSNRKIKKYKQDKTSSKDHEKNKHKSKHSSRDKGDNRDNKQKYNISGSELEERNTTSMPWLRNDLRVRVIDKSLRGGEHYGEKVVIVDVPSYGKCVCKTHDGRIIEGVRQSSVETVVPRSENAFVAIVGGPSRGQLGQIMKRDKNQCLAVVQLLTDRDTILQLHYDDICEFVGDMHHCDDY